MTRTRFIPTCVGNRQETRRTATSLPVHPHVCGEQCTRLLHIGRIPRFIPTCVGNSPPGAECCVSIAVHPHVCGEQGLQTVGRQSSNGSSPRVWGTVVLNQIPAARFRFIPTCVGNSHVVICPAVLIAVHPHVCGEQAPSPAPKAWRYGSSPRVWGTVVTKNPKPFIWRFIPTCVGNRLRRLVEGLK